MKTINVAITSFGMSGNVFHAPLLHTHPGFVIKKILERTKNLSSEKYSYATIVRKYEDILSDNEIDLVIVNTPDYLHYEMTREALQAGKHVVVEKPFTRLTREAEELISLAKTKQKVLSVFQNRRWDGDFLTVRQVIDQNLLGRLVEYESHFDRYRNYVPENTWKEDPDTGPGTLYNLGSHLIDQALVLFGMPESVTADIRYQRPGSKVDDAFTLWLNYPDIKVTLKAAYLAREPGPRYSLHGTEGSFLKQGIDQQEEKLNLGEVPGGPDWGKEEEKYWGTLNTSVGNLHFIGKIETQPGNYLAYYDNIWSAVNENATLAVPATEGINVIKIIETAVESHKLEKSVRL